MSGEQSAIRDLFTVTEVELVYKSKSYQEEKIKITSSKEAYAVFLSAWDMNKIDLVEQVNILLLDNSNAVLGFSHIATGGITACLIDPKIIFATALTARASGIILAHNHPSHNLQPSQADTSLTQKLRDGGKLLEITILDHLIVTPHSYYSFADAGLVL